MLLFVSGISYICIKHIIEVMLPLYLLGYMGSGKTTLGRELSRLTGRPFVDMDTLIENRCGMTINDIFSQYGEDYFRRLETETLHSTAKLTDTIVALGGGTPCHGDNMDWMLDNGITVFLDASIEKLYQRLLHSRYKRPLIAKLSDSELFTFIQDSLNARLPHYRRASFIFNSDTLDHVAEREEAARRFASQFGLDVNPDTLHERLQ